MKVYKQKQFLIFEFDDGKLVKYDFANHTSIGKKGYMVNGLSGQLRGIRIEDMLKCCSDPKYAKFLSFIRREEHDKTGREITNIGTLLNKVCNYGKFEQFFSAGIDNVSCNFRYKIGDIPTGLLKILRKHSIKLTNVLYEVYKQNPDAVNTAFNLEYVSLTPDDVYDMITRSDNHYYLNARIINGRYEATYIFNNLIERFGYNATSFMKYADYMKTYEAIENMEGFVIEFMDYCRMMHSINPRFEKYPKHFLTTHKIATRNYNRLKKEFDEELFKKRIKPDMEYSYGNYRFIYPKNANDIKAEAVMQNNCVASYIQSVLDGKCDILFLRSKDNLDHSLVTIEVRGGQIVQARQHYNYPVTQEQQKAIDMWNAWYSKKKVVAA